MAIQVAANAVVGFVDRVAVLGAIAQQVFEDQAGKLFVLVAAGDFGSFDLAGDVALFVGEELVLIAVAGNQALFFQSCQGRFQLLTNGNTVIVDLGQ